MDKVNLIQIPQSPKVNKSYKPSESTLETPLAQGVTPSRAERVSNCTGGSLEQFSHP